MISVDVNVLVQAFREDSPSHGELRMWLEQLVGSESSFALSDIVLSGFLRIVTHPRIFDPPTPLAPALEFAETIRSQPNCVSISPGRGHWKIFCRLCEQADARGNLIPDAYLAALAIESGCDWVSSDRDFSRFPGLRWRPPGRQARS